MCVCDNCWRFKHHIPKRSIEHNRLQTNSSMWSFPICRSFPDRETMSFPTYFCSFTPGIQRQLPGLPLALSCSLHRQRR